jgi:hypothetical protein
MKSSIRLAGRFSVFTLSAILLEGLFTLGNAFDWKSYSAISWIIQSLVLVLCVWGAVEWHEEAERELELDNKRRELYNKL